MQETRTMTCISCPVGCQLTLTVNDGELVSVSNNECKRGAAYARDEFYNPRRILTSTVKVVGGVVPQLPVRTRGPIPKGLLMEGMRALRSVVVKAPIEVGSVVVCDFLGTGQDLIASRSVSAVAEEASIRRHE